MERAYREFLYRRSGPLGSLAKGGLSLLSWIYSSAVHLRNSAYDRGFFRSQRPPDTLVISIGNLQVGGTGKTPFTLFLAEHLNHFTKTAILTRGYKSQLSHLPPTRINDDLGLKFSASLSGDEPSLLANRLPSTPIFVGKDRLASAQIAAAQGAKALLLDDGFQHRRLKRDVDIVLIDTSLPQEAHYCLPRGFLREKHTALSRAHLIVLTQVHSPSQFSQISQSLARFSDAPVIAAQLKVAKICTSHATVTKNMSSLEGALFCGIANPASFVQTIAQLNLRTVSQHFYNDHAHYTYEQIVKLAEKARQNGASCLICTEKDAVKIAPWMDRLPLPVLWPVMDFAITHDDDVWGHFIEDLKERIKACG